MEQNPLNSEHGNPSYLEGNSHKSKDRNLLEYEAEQERKRDKRTGSVVSTNAVKAKKPLAKRVMASEPNEIKSRLLQDVIFPAIKEMIRKGATTALDMALYGESRDIPRERERERMPYNSIYDRRRRERVNTPMFDFDEVLFDGGGDMLKAEEDARAVLREMLRYLDEYGFVSVAEFYEFAGYSTEHTDNRWGWESLSSANIMRVRNGYVISLPRPRPLEA